MNITGDLTVTSGNLYVQNGMGVTESTNGKGNLILGYNDSATGFPRTGSHNLVVGDGHGWTSHSGIVCGVGNQILDRWSAVICGDSNTASGEGSSVTAGFSNTASDDTASVSGGARNVASGRGSSVTGGDSNNADGIASVVSGGKSVSQGTDSGWAAGSAFGSSTISADFRSP